MNQPYHVYWAGNSDKPFQFHYHATVKASSPAKAIKIATKNGARRYARKWPIASFWATTTPSHEMTNTDGKTIVAVPAYLIVTKPPD
jgi:hypothetical protein